MTTSGLLDFDALVSAIQHAHEHTAAQVGKAVNTSLTLRNWIIGAYIAEYELLGKDRAKYGDNLLSKLAARLKALNVSTCDKRRLYLYLRFYHNYPRIVRSVTAQSQTLLPQSIASRPVIVRPEAAHLGLDPEALIQKLSYTHIEQLLSLDDPLKRSFYEIECIRGNWSVRQLKRQIASLYFERSGLSRDKDKLAAMVNAGAETAEPRLTIRDPYVFEFLGLRGKDAAAESTVEAALIENLRDFLLELGRGFCLEAQQKSILIGETHGFVDLVFYHRLLKCHVLVELKIDEFRHEHIGQLNTYVSWYSGNMMADGDSPPVGLLLCTRKDHALVEYALAGMDNRLFVSKYQLKLPGEDEIRRFLEEKMKEVGAG